MKTKFLLSISIVGLMLASCSSDDTAPIIIETGGQINAPTSGATIELNATYQENLTLDPENEYVITGPVIMTNGTTLTIPAGMTIKARNGVNSYIAISQGAKIIAEGTSSQPIILTSESATPNAGDWGGLIILGKAPINSVSGSGTSTSEIATLPYGGQISNDNSGIIRYMRIEYSGGAADGQTENNGFSFYGVGSGTTAQYLQAFEGKDDGFEFYGGTVDAQFISALNCQDDSIDWTEGYSGKLTDVHVKHGASHDKGIEADGFNTDIGNSSNPKFFSKPTITNLTIIGLGSGTGNEAVRLRAGTRGLFSNVFIVGFEEAFDLDGDSQDSPTGQGVLDGELVVNGVQFSDVSVKLKNDTGVNFNESDFIKNENTTTTGTAFGTWGAGWTRQ